MDRLPRALPCLALLSGLILFSGACAAPGRGGPPPAAPDFALKDVSGKIVRLADFRGKTVLVDFWAAWCDPCRDSIPSYEKLYERLRDKGLVVVGIDEDPQTGVAEAFVNKFSVTYPILLDRENEAFDAYGVRTLPTAFLIDPQGNIRRKWTGFEAETKADIEKVAPFEGSLPNR